MTGPAAAPAAAGQRVTHCGLSAARSAPTIDGAAAFIPVSAGVYRLEASLTFATAPLLHKPGLKRIDAASGELVFDLQGVTATDSAGLALLIDWLAEARARSRTLRYSQPPEAMLVLARLSDVATLITG
ncbi:MAG TPA: STAS domain-containing protein [Steroidobacteraceae bacterium]|jgi:phospholipid transport system transporter-binding protein